LDYIAWQLAKRYSPSPPVLGKDKSIYFPILDAPTGDGADRFAKMARKWSFPTVAISLIESVQPYQAGYEPLGLLASLVNPDKHCAPVLTVAYVNTISFRVTVQGQPIPQLIMNPPGSVVELTGFGASAMEVEKLGAGNFRACGVFHVDPTRASETAIPLVSAQLPRSVKVDGQAIFFVSLQNPLVPLEPVDRTIQDIVKCVADIVPRFDQLF
jgi:hypothetical protein